MTDEQIKQNAEICVFTENSFRKYHKKIILTPSEEKIAKDFYIAGAHSRDEEIEELKKLLFEKECDIQFLEYKLHSLWISVEDRLPEKTKGVFSCEVRELEEDKIVYYKDTRGYIHTGYLNANNHWRDLDRDNTAIYTVTHWMPTPELKRE